MENASKALLIAAAILIAILILTLLVAFGDKLAAYFSASHEEVMLQQMIEFNNKFQNYNGKTIRGSDLVSIMNKIVNYNNYQAEMVGYEKVKIEINLFGHEGEFLYGGESGANKLIKRVPINNFDNDNQIKHIATTSTRLTTTEAVVPGITDVQLQKLSASISEIVEEPKLSDYASYEQYEEELKSYKKYRAQKLTNILGKEFKENDDVTKIKQVTYQYHQFTYFKRAMFKCTGVEYDEYAGTVNKLTFDVVLETSHDGTKKIKFD